MQKNKKNHVHVVSHNIAGGYLVMRCGAQTNDEGVIVTNEGAQEQDRWISPAFIHTLDNKNQEYCIACLSKASFE